MTCPDCKSKNAVPVSEAWEALKQVPAEAQDRIKRLERIKNAALKIEQSWDVGFPDDVATVSIPVVHLEELKRAFDQ